MLQWPSEQTKTKHGSQFAVAKANVQNTGGVIILTVYVFATFFLIEFVAIKQFPLVWCVRFSEHV